MLKTRSPCLFLSYLLLNLLSNIYFILICCSQRRDNILSCNLLFGLVAHFVLVNNVDMSFFLREILCIFQCWFSEIISMYSCRKGGQLIWIAPSGGRDRPDSATLKWKPVSFSVTFKEASSWIHGVNMKSL